MKEIVNISKEELGTILSRVESAIPITIVAKTLVAMNKNFKTDEGKVENPYHNKIYKTQKSNVFVAIDYETAVNKRLIKEGKNPEFEASARKWGEKIGESPVIVKDNNYYLQTYFVTNNKPEVSYEILEDDTYSPIDKSRFEQYLKPTSQSKQGLENEIVVKTFKLDNILEVRALGKIYRIE